MRLSFIVLLFILRKIELNTLIPFQFESKEVRVVLDAAGQPMFVAKDVAEALGYSNTSDAISRHCKGVVNRYPLPTAGGIQEVRVIYEPDVYALIFGSHLESSEKFKRWIFEEVLPTIRKTGSYALPNAEPPKQRPLATDTVLQLPACIDAIKAIFPNLGESSLQALAGDICELDLGRRLIPSPVIEEKFYTATEIAQTLGVTPQKIGRLANSRGIKQPAYGEYRLSKSKHSTKQVEQFYYNSAGRAALEETLHVS